MTQLPKQKPIRSDRLRKAANGEACTMNGPVCNFDRSTVVLCHLNEQYAGKGFGQKADDTAAFFGCSACHNWYDSNKGTKDERNFYTQRAVVRTIRRQVELGNITIKGAK